MNVRFDQLEDWIGRYRYDPWGQAIVPLDPTYGQ
jgi:hypothetical protein